MAVNQIPALFRTKYIDEFRMDFDRERSILSQTVKGDGIVGAETVKWDVVDPADEAREKTRDGKIPASQLGLSQVSATLRNIHIKYNIDDFDAFMTNPNVRSAMSKKGAAAIRKSVDNKIVTTLDTTSVQLNSGSAVSFSTFGTFLNWTTTLWNNDVPNDGRVWGIVSPNANAQMLRITEYKSADFVPIGAVSEGQRTMGYREWLGVKWLMFTGLTGRGTSAAKCYIYHEEAIGHMLSGEPEPVFYVNDEDAYSGVRYEAKDAAAICLPRGICRAVHDDTAAFS